MQKLLSSIIFLALLSGCAGPMTVHSDHKIPSSLSDVGQEAQKLVNESRALSITAKLTIDDNLQQGVMTPDEAQKYANQLKTFRQRLDDIQKAIDGGAYADALKSGDVTKTLINTLLKEVINEAAKRRAVKKSALDLTPYFSGA